MTETKSEESLPERRHAEDEQASLALRTALRMTGLPPLAVLEAVSAHQVSEAVGEVNLGRCSARTARAIADTLMDHARLNSRR
ncbi:hypothetical protein [Kitasatospora sp. HPMI-4]|uniref:hypothetical protein n=1 Tax=Kitasatospora sp. HPMI-4 TaxID=3448443 RepID=UPI003F1D1D92